MKVYDTDKIRNLVFIGHGGCGKTSLVSGILYFTGMTTRLGRVDEGNATTDFDEDEIARKISIRSALAYCEYDKHKINLIDTPGYMAFIQGAREAVRAADTAVVVVDAIAGVEVQTEKVWSFADEFSLPRVIAINRMDRENADFERALENVQSVFGRIAIPVQIPIGKEKDLKGVVDLVNQKAYLFKDDDSGKFELADIPAELKDETTSRREALMEMVAESDEELMAKFFDQGTLSDEDLLSGLKKGILARAIVPVFCTAGVPNFGTAALLDAAVKYFPSPAERGAFTAIDPKTNEPVSRHVSPTEPYVAYVFRTIADPFAGRISIFKVFSGTIQSDTTIYSVNGEASERIGSLQVMQGKTPSPISEVKAGDIAAVAKLKVTQTGHTLADPGKLVDHPGAQVSRAGDLLRHRAQEPRRRGEDQLPP